MYQLKKNSSNLGVGTEPAPCRLLQEDYSSLGFGNMHPFGLGMAATLTAIVRSYDPRRMVDGELFVLVR